MLLATADDSMITTYTTNIDTTLSVGIVVVSISISDDVQGVGVSTKYVYGGIQGNRYSSRYSGSVVV